MISVDEARSQFREGLSCLKAIETVPLIDALGRVCASEIHSEINVPPADNSAMDGVALNFGDFTDPNKVYEVSQRITAGSRVNRLISGTAARIFTGGEMPEGADAVVMQEHCQFLNEGREVIITGRVSAGQHIRRKGQDISAGETLVEQGHRLSAIDLGCLASVGIEKVSVYQPLRIALISTGNELVEPGQALAPGQIYDSNRALLHALCKNLAYQVIDFGVVEDDLDATIAIIEEAATQADIIVSSGGVSVGEEDHLRSALNSIGRIENWKVRMKPGKPVLFGTVADTPLIGLPGNPVSAFIVFQVLLMPVLHTLQGESVAELVAHVASAGFEKAEATREEFVRVRVSIDNGKMVALPYPNQSSGVLSSISWADGVIRQRVGQSIAQGDDLEYLPLVSGML